MYFPERHGPTLPPSSPPPADDWPSLPLEEWRDTYATLHMMTQVVGKVRLATAPWVNHWWHVPLYVSPRGLSTGLLPHGSRTFEVGFDFLDHVARVTVDDGGEGAVELRSRPVAEFYRELMATLAKLGVPVRIWRRPVEIENPIPFDEDYEHTTYDAAYAHRWWRAMEQATRVLSEFRSRFVGKSSPVHFFWGSFDLAVTRFSGRRAPAHPGGIPNLADWVTREAYSHECTSCGFWPGSGAVQQAAFYAYAYPEPAGMRDRPVRPEAAYYSDEMREFILPYDAVRLSEDPDGVLLDFCQTTYEAGAVLGGWNREELEQDSRSGGRAVRGEAPAFPRHDEEPERSG